ncbi:saccharopine dehydrogenase family protein [Pseudoruegeria sp. HB172150]|uniref:saccharopine dehydrogenase family protein n=1 Tax=Pseudoruegeria sp. HB172150 TaxID=2721164 RepID=UPI0015518860|nr:saccharopine dehydrogenase family protein [Pseudoruegeria sp. HB172150]
MTIHWCGTGLSSLPGLRRLIGEGHDIAVYSRTLGEVQAAVGDLTDRTAAFDMDELEATLTAGDVVVSMLPADMHMPLANLAVAKGTHFVSSSYITPEMRDLQDSALTAGVALVNEVGLDPGIDHVMAHWLMADYRRSPAYNPKNTLSFLSFCGGVPMQSNAFRYKFSWSPLGVLKALKSPSKSIRDFSELEVRCPWHALTTYSAPLPQPETFEVYPNRDSLPFMAQYGFEPGWPVKQFVRGTLRLNGWADAWSEVFDVIDAAEGPEGDERLRALSDELWAKYAYEKDEPDRVVLCVALLAEDHGVPVYHKTYALEAWGDARGSAMARLVSGSVALAVEAVLNREIPVGVSAAPSDPKLVAWWMEATDCLAQHLQVVNHLR